ncbi:2-phospho-L-lactate guanylyltransferase [Microbacterium sp. NPDC076911]|uniref:2-phospho-L-lactate guanylyltransferase n=1 Tax=Microbacterium sp. NPDC076911 TaxID=3154958 RepID=UPI003434C0A9
MTRDHSRGGWAVVIPVKAATRGKSRLDVPDVNRVALARAIALDTISAVAACDVVARIVVVTDDPTLAIHAGDIPQLRFVDEGDAGGLNQAIERGVKTIPDGMLRAALLADLPALQSPDLERTLNSAASIARGVVADVDGTGSTLVTMQAGSDWKTAFGEGSFAKHLALRHVPLDVPEDSSLRRDVDTAEHLALAQRLGVGPRTASVLAQRAVQGENSR